MLRVNRYVPLCLAERAQSRLIQCRTPSLAGTPFCRFCRRTCRCSLGDPPVERPFDLVDLAQFGVRNRCDAIRFAENPQFVACVDRERVSACFHQRRFGVLILTEESPLLQRLGIHHAERPLQHDEQPALALPERFQEVFRTLFDGFHGQLAPRTRPEL